MSIKFSGKAVPFTIWNCAECPIRDRAKRPDGLPSNYCIKCEAKFLATINAYRSKKDKLWFLKGRKNNGTSISAAVPRAGVRSLRPR